MASKDVQTSITIQAGHAKLEGFLAIPNKAKSIVIFAHGSGSSRFSPRNSYVAKVLQEKNLATLLFDLLTREEDMLYENRFNIDLLAQRLADTTKWVKDYPDTKDMSIGYFGASTGAAAALQASVMVGPEVKAIVSRGGRPDLVMQYLPKVNAPTLLIVGEKDEIVIELNKQAFRDILAEKRLVIVPNASHLFEEPGTLEEVARLATEWFIKHL